jgi:hypothetical protein
MMTAAPCGDERTVRNEVTESRRKNGIHTASVSLLRLVLKIFNFKQQTRESSFTTIGNDDVYLPFERVG